MNTDTLIHYARRFGLRAALLTSYCVVGIIGLDALPASAAASITLSPAGIAFAAVVLYGYRILPPLMLAALAVQLIIGVPPIVAAITAVGNVLGPLVGAYVLRKVTHFQPEEFRLSDTIGIVSAGLLSSVTSASIAISGLSVVGSIMGDAVASTWVAWWTADMLGILIFAPFFLSLYSARTVQRSALRTAEWYASIVSVSAMSFYIFWTSQTYLTYYILFVPLTWVALRTGQRGTSLAILMFSSIAIFGTRLAYGPFIEQGLLLEIFIVTTSAVFLILSTVVEDRKRGYRVLEGHVSTLEKALTQISSEDDAKTKFLAVLAHELRNPLAAILSSAELIKLEGSRTPDAILLLDTIDEQVQAMSNLLDDLLDLSRITNEKMVLRQEIISLNEIVDRSVRAADALTRKYEHTLSVTKPARDILVYADPLRIEQVLLNLLNNAAKYTKPHGSIRISSEVDGDMAVIKVSDNGIGIPPKQLERIFEQYYQIQDNDVTTQGLGIGLSLTRNLVEMHGGSIEATSKGKNQGSEFIVRIPIPRDVQTSIKTAAKPHTRKAHTVRLSKPGIKILVVDDNAGAATSLGRLLTLHSHDVLLAYTGTEAVGKARAFRPDVIILDIGLPDIDGYEVARRLQQSQDFSGTLLALTGYGQKGDKEKARAAGFYAHLTKPVGLEEIETILKKVSREKSLSL